MTYFKPVTPVSLDPWMEHAKEIIFADYGVDVSLAAKNKDLLKFGRNENVGTSAATIQNLPSGILHEAYVTSNLINRIVSSNAGDTQTVVIEGHTISGGLFTFVTQTAILTGQTAVALTTPLARVTRVYNIGTTDLAGVVAVTQLDTYTAGVPDTPAKVHLRVPAGANGSFKASTTISNADFWVLTHFYADVEEKTAASAEIRLQVRTVGSVFRTVATKSASNTHAAVHEFKPYYIVPPNADVRLVAIASGAGVDVSGGIQGSLLTTV